MHIDIHIYKQTEKREKEEQTEKRKNGKGKCGKELIINSMFK